MIIISVLSCGQNSSEKHLNGKWYESKNSIWHFYPDSLVITADLKNTVKWSATESKVEFEHPYFYLDSLEKPIDTHDKIIINYNLSKSKDYLFGSLKNRFGTHKLELLKAKNYIEYLNKKHEIQFTLPKDHNAKFINTEEIFGLKVFLAITNNKVVGKTELSKNLNYLKSDIKMFKDSIKTNGRSEVDGYDKFYDNRFHFRVFADKNISDSIIINRLPIKLEARSGDTIPVKIYRMYESTTKDNPIILKGKKIVTIANNV